MSNGHQPNMLQMKRPWERPRICFANPHRLWAANHGPGKRGQRRLNPLFPKSALVDGAGNGTSAYLLRKYAPASGGKPRSEHMPGQSGLNPTFPRSPVLGGAGNGTSAYLLRKYAPASGAYRRLRLLAINASRLFNARTLSGSSPGALSKKARHRNGAVLVLFTGAGNGTRTRECQLGKLMPYHLAMPACVLASITRLSCSIQG